MFQPIVPVGGYAGWQILQRTLPTQKAAYDASPVNARDVEYFRENISNVQTPEDLVNDRQLLTVALGAFGLDEDINNKAFIERILSDGYSDSDALSNRMADKRYLSFATAFGFGEGILPRTALSKFPDEIISAFSDRQFEISIGDQDENMRLALSAQRELTELAEQELSDEARWFTLMGNSPLRTVFEKALGLPSSIGSVDIDKQREFFEDAATRVFGTSDLTDFGDPEMQENVIRRFMAQAQIEAGPSMFTPGATALTLLGVQV